MGRVTMGKGTPTARATAAEPQVQIVEKIVEVEKEVIVEKPVEVIKEVIVKDKSDVLDIINDINSIVTEEVERLDQRVDQIMHEQDELHKHCNQEHNDLRTRLTEKEVHINSLQQDIKILKQRTKEAEKHLEQEQAKTAKLLAGNTKDIINLQIALAVVAAAAILGMLL